VYKLGGKKVLCSKSVALERKITKTPKEILQEERISVPEQALIYHDEENHGKVA